MNPIFLLAFTSIVNLQCVGGEYKMDFTLDLASKAGEIYYTSPVGSSLYLSDRLTVTPNYIVFPAEGGNITFNRKDSTFTRNRLEGVCEVVEREESKRVF